MLFSKDKGFAHVKNWVKHECLYLVSILFLLTTLIVMLVFIPKSMFNRFEDQLAASKNLTSKMFPNPNSAPFIYSSKPNNNKEKSVSGVYYSNWSAYSPRNHFPHDIDFSRISHVYYSFFVIDEDTGKVKSSDDYSNYQLEFVKKLYKDFPDLPKKNSNSSHVETPVVKGMIGELFYLKTSNFLNNVSSNITPEISNFKVLMSVGGWANKDAFHIVAHDEKKFEAFVESCVETMFANGFDGIDIDWEFPENDGVEPERFYEMLKSIREKLDGLQRDIFGDEKAKSNNNKFELTVALPCLKEDLEKVALQKIDQYIDYYNLMAYDLAGEWSEKTAYHSNLFPRDTREPLTKHGLRHRMLSRVYKHHSQKDTADGEANVNSGVQYLLHEVKLPSKKIVLGMPLYGRGFTHVNATSSASKNRDYTNLSYDGVGGKSDGEPGMWLYNQLPDGKEFFDRKSLSAFSYNSKTNTFVGYDNRDSMIYKSSYVMENNLGGGFWWESCGENKATPLIKEFHDNLNTTAMKNNESLWKSKMIRTYYLNKYGKKSDKFLIPLFNQKDK